MAGLQCERLVTRPPQDREIRSQHDGGERFAWLDLRSRVSGELVLELLRELVLCRGR
jgi:hypothetical protein